MTEPEFRQWLKDDVATYGSQKEAAWIYGISQPYLGDILHGRRDPGVKLLDAVGFSRVVSYERKDR